MKKNKTTTVTTTETKAQTTIQNIAELGSGLSMIASAAGTIVTVAISVYSTVHNRKLKDAMHQADTMYVQAKLAILSYMNSSTNDTSTKSIEKDLDRIIMRTRETKNLVEINKSIKYFTSIYDRYKPIEDIDDDTTENILNNDNV